MIVWYTFSINALRRINLFTPHYLLPDVFALSDEMIEKLGIRGIIFDIDNTLVSYKTPKPTEKVLAYLAHLKELGIQVAIVSNNSRRRVSHFAEGLGIPAYHRSAKPLGVFLHKVRRRFNLPAKNIALVGDQVFTDALGANCAGMISVLVDPIELKENAFFRLKRSLEKPIIDRKRRKDQLK